LEDYWIHSYEIKYEKSRKAIEQREEQVRINTFLNQQQRNKSYLKSYENRFRSTKLN